MKKDFLAEVKKESGLSSEELADAIGVVRQTLNKAIQASAKKDILECPVKVLESISKGAGVTVAALDHLFRLVDGEKERAAKARIVEWLKSKGGGGK